MRSPNELVGTYGNLTGQIQHNFRRRVARRKLSGLPDGAKLHLGCGRNRFQGWMNIDIDRSVEPDLQLDLRWGLPVRAVSVRFIYNEHLLEHLSFEAGFALLRDCRAALRPGGVLRIAMPDLEALARAYLGDWRDQAWLRDPAYEWIDSAAAMLNHAFRGWGHQYLYDREEVCQRLKQAGFADVSDCDWGESRYPELRGLETREESNLIVEAVAP